MRLSSSHYLTAVKAFAVRGEVVSVLSAFCLGSSRPIATPAKLCYNYSKQSSVNLEYLDPELTTVVTLQILPHSSTRNK